MAELTTYARPYAKAAYLYASENNTLTHWQSMLELAAKVVQDPQMTAWLERPDKGAKDRVDALAAVCGEVMNAAGINFSSQLSEHHRLSLLPEIFALFRQMQAEAEQTVDVELSSAYALSDANTDKLITSLKKRLGREVNVTTNVDQSLLGGLVIRAGDTVIDGSVRGRLARLAEQLNS